MKRLKLVLALAAVMVAMLVAFSAPALANDRDDRRDRWDDNRRWDWDRNWDRNWWVDDWDWDRDWWDDDCEWELEDEKGWVLGPWGWYWGDILVWELDC